MPFRYIYIWKIGEFIIWLLVGLKDTILSQQKF